MIVIDMLCSEYNHILLIIIMIGVLHVKECRPVITFLLFFQLRLHVC